MENLGSILKHIYIYDQDKLENAHIHMPREHTCFWDTMKKMGIRLPTLSISPSFDR